MTDDRRHERTGAVDRTATAANRHYENGPIEGGPDDSRADGPKYIDTVESGGTWHYDEHGGELFKIDPDSKN